MTWGWGISPNKTENIPLGDYNSDHYITLVYHAMVSLGWHVGYFDHDGLIAYTPISWASYSEEVSVRLRNNTIIIKSECVGYQGWFTDYGKNRKNLDRLFDEITFIEAHVNDKLEATTQELIDCIPEKQFLNLDDPPLAGKELLRGFFGPFKFNSKYSITPVLLIVNIILFIGTSVTFYLLKHAIDYGQLQLHLATGETWAFKLYMLLGFNNREHVLNGQFWRLLTSVFLHFSLVHIFFNMVVLVYIGSLLEFKLGKWNFLVLYLCTGIIASVASISFHYTEVTGGASGAIFGLFGILLALLSTDFYERSARTAFLISTGIVVAYNIIPVGETVDHAAHFAGLISGYLFGWLAYLGFNHKNTFIKKWGIAVIGCTIVILLVAGCELFMPHYQVEEFARLTDHVSQLNDELNHDFYNQDAYGQPAPVQDRTARLDMIEQTGLPKLTELKKLGNQIAVLKLPSKKKKAANAQVKLIGLLCKMYNSVYLEFKEQDSRKYRPQIDSLTDEINNVRWHWQDE
jgi:rhomboid protease GluP